MLHKSAPAKIGSPGVDFIKIKSWVQIIEIALSICAQRLRPTFTLQKASQKLGAVLLHHAPNFMKSTPDGYYLPQVGHSKSGLLDLIFDTIYVPCLNGVHKLDKKLDFRHF